jgi:predicted transcriptional regulator
MRFALPTVVVLIASLVSATIANPVPAPDLPNSIEKRVIASLNPTTAALPEPTPTDASPAIDTGVLNCQKRCKDGYHYCLGTGSTVPLTQ